MNVVTLTKDQWPSILLLLRDYLERAHAVGSFRLDESSTLERCLNVLDGKHDPEIDMDKAITNVVAGVQRGNGKAAWKLNETPSIFNVVKFVQSKTFLATKPVPEITLPPEVDPPPLPSLPAKVSSTTEKSLADELTEEMPLLVNKKVL